MVGITRSKVICIFLALFQVFVFLELAVHFTTQHLSKVHGFFGAKVASLRQKKSGMFVLCHKDPGMGYLYIDVSKNSGTPKSSILIGFSIIKHQFWGSPIFGNPHIPAFIVDLH